jgi:hypothetical protein
MLKVHVAHYTGPVVNKSEESTLLEKSACERRENPAVIGRSAVILPGGPLLAELLKGNNRNTLDISTHMAKSAARSSRVRFRPRCVINTPVIFRLFYDARYDSIVRPRICTPRYLKISQ